MAAFHHFGELDTPLGPVSFAVDRLGRLCRLEFRSAAVRCAPREAAVRRLSDQLAEYFSGARETFEVELAPQGTPFQLSVWDALTTIPYGKTWSYAELARQIGKPGAARAVGQANGANPIPIVVPCHRVIAADGSIGGYSGGLGIKRKLLAVERAALAA
jgi:methylated-DNA-[protein]-cysteine S-methyltransferase